MIQLRSAFSYAWCRSKRSGKPAVRDIWKEKDTYTRPFFWAYSSTWRWHGVNKYAGAIDFVLDLNLRLRALLQGTPKAGSDTLHDLPKR